MKKVYIKRCLRITSLILALILTINFLQFYMLERSDHSQVRIDGFLMEPEDSLQVVLMGSSEIYNGYHAGQAYGEYGFTSYPLAIPVNPVSMWRYELREILKHQKPKLLIVEVNGITYNREKVDPLNEATLRKFTDNLPADDVKKAMVEELGTDSKASYYLPLLKYHSRWTSVKTNIIGMESRLAMKKRGSSLLKGSYHNCRRAKHKKTRKVEGDLSVEVLDPFMDSEYRLFLDELAKSGIPQVLFVRFPHQVENTPTSYLRYQRSNMAGEIAESYGFDYINFDAKKEKLGFDAKKDFYDVEHLNVRGAKRMTHILAKYVSGHYDLGEPNLSEKQKRDWEESAEAMTAFMKYCKQMTLTNKSGDRLDVMEDVITLKRMKNQ